MQRMEEVILMSKEKMSIWGREFEMEVMYDCYVGEEVLDSQKEALAHFLKAKDGIEASLEEVKKYCLEQNGAEIGDGTITNIFKFVAPKYLYVARTVGKHIVAVMCNYKFDQENGIAVVFEDGKMNRIGRQDIVL